jgi:nucleotide-binding universal stress UspA family protein
MAPYASIAVAFDGSDSAVQAAMTASWIAEKFHSTLTLLGVVPVPPRPEEGSQSPELREIESGARTVEAALKHEKERLEKSGLTQVRTKLLHGPVVDALLEQVAAEPPDLLVVGARGLSAAGRIFLGSVSDGVVHHAHCPVLVVRPAPPR